MPAFLYERFGDKRHQSVRGVEIFGEIHGEFVIVTDNGDIQRNGPVSSMIYLFAWGIFCSSNGDRSKFFVIDTKGKTEIIENPDAILKALNDHPLLIRWMTPEMATAQKHARTWFLHRSRSTFFEKLIAILKGA